jgi:hypothetical protein
VSRTPNQKIVVWARGKLGKKVGAGECWDLAEQSLKQAGAMTSHDLGPVASDTDYVWGDPVAGVKDVQPGDIIQLRDHEAETVTVKDYVLPDGSTWTETKSSVAKRGHHTAIANGMLDRNGALKTLEQHVKPKGDVVQNKTLQTRSLAPQVTKGTERRANPFTKKLETAKVTTTVTVTVSGTMWIYRPKPKAK